MRLCMRVAIVGGGFVGLFTAYYLLKRDVEVVIYDVEPRGGRASENNAGLITPSFSATPRISLFTLVRAVLGMGGFIRVSLSEVLRRPGW
ncbi:MAG: FAD-dependent oxidoreductase, partial [Sulfolobales archaeon]